MTQEPQAIFDRLKKNKERRKELRDQLKEAYLAVPAYFERDEKRKTIMEEMKTLRLEVEQDYPQEVDELDSLKQNIEADKILLSDIMLAAINRNEPVEIKDEGQLCFPLFSVKLVPAK